MKISKKQRQLIDFSNILSARSGISINLEYRGLSNKERLIACLIKGMLIFFCSYGLLGLFITSFQLPCMRLILFLATFLFSFLVALFYYNKWFFNIGYIGILLLFCAAAFMLYIYANSGVNAIINIAMDIIDEKMNLQGVRTYQEFITNRTVTITCCLLLVTVLQCCFFNSTISGYMNPILVFFQLFPVVQLCMYFDDEINYFYFIMIMMGYIGVLILRRSRYSSVPIKGNPQNVTIKGTVIKSTNLRPIKKMSNMFIASICFVLFITIVAGILVFFTPFRLKSNYSSWKTKTDKIVEQFAMSGLFAFFNRYESTGGIGEGKLGGVREVQMDFEPDLEIHMVPDNEDGVYLKGFVGEVYANNQWNPLSEYKSLYASPYYFSDMSELVNKESSFLEYFYAHNAMGAKAKMEIKNLDANEKYLYFPYYTMINPDTIITQPGYHERFHGDVVYSVFSRNMSYTFEYYPFLNISEYCANVPMLFPEYDNVSEQLYRNYVYKNYLKVPDNIRNDLRKICDKYIPGESREEIINQIKEYFKENFVYTLRPGSTPNKRDFVVYFLTKQKKGFCAHFATAAAMLLREKGIPARYVEGYFVQFTDALDISIDVTKDADEWYSGFNQTLEDGEEMHVVDIMANDSNAHAWVEVYFDGFGWIPVEFTVADEEESEEGGSFWSRIGFNFSGDGNTDSPIDNIANQLKDSAPLLLAIAIGLIACVLVAFYIARIYRMYRLYYHNSNDRIVQQYMTVTKLLKKYGIAEEQNLYHHITLDYLINRLNFSDTDARRFISIIEEASYGNTKMSDEYLEISTGYFKKFLKELQKIVTKRQRLEIKIRY